LKRRGREAERDAATGLGFDKNSQRNDKVSVLMDIM
jgi:hypothetical protein